MIKDKKELKSDIKDKLLEINSMLDAKNSPKIIYSNIHKILKTILKADNFYIALIDNKAKTLEFPYYEDETGWKTKKRKMGNGLTETVIINGKSILCTDISFKKIRVKENIKLQGPDSKIWLGCPLKIRDKIIGAIAIQDYKDRKAYDSDSVKVMELIASQVARVIERKRLEDKLTKSNKELTKRVEQRTSELIKLNVKMRKEKEEIRLLANSIDSAEECISITDMKDNIIFVNKAFENTYGYKKKELMGKHISILRPEEDQPEAKEILPETTRGGWKGELINKRKNGELFPIALITSIVENEKKEEIALIGIARDITLEKISESKIRESEEKFRLIAESSIAGVYIIQDNIFLYVSPAFKQIFGYEIEEIERKLGPKDLTVPEDREIVAANVRKRINEGVPSIQYEFRGLRKDGGRIFVEVFGSRTIYQGKPAIIGTLIDRTNRAKALQQTEKLSRVVEQSPASVVITNPFGNIEYVNGTFCKSTGYNLEEVIGKNPRIFKSDYHNNKFYEDMWDTLLSGKNWEGEILNKKKNGELYWESVLISPMVNDKGDLTNFIAIKSDITEKKKNEASLNLLRTLAEHSNDAIEILDPNNGQFLNCNKKAYEDLGYTREEFLSLSLLDIDPKLDKKTFPETVKMIRKTGSLLIETIHRQKSGYTFPVEVNITYVKLDQEYIIAVVRDITRRKKSEQEIRRLNRVYAVLSNINQAIVRIKDKQKLLDEACRIAVEDGKLIMSWIGLINSENDEFQVAASNGIIEGYIEEAIIPNKRIPAGFKSIKNIINEGKVLITNDIEKLDLDVFWREPALKRGYKSLVVIPIKVLNKAIGNFSLYSDEINFFEEKEIVLLEEICSDISFALETMEVEKEKMLAIEKVRQSEEKYRNLVDNALLGVYESSITGEILFANEQLLKNLGVNSIEQLKGTDILDKYANPSDRIIFINELRDNGYVKNFEVDFISNENQVKHTLISATFQGDKIIGMILDITDKKKAEIAMLEAKEKAEEMNRLKNNFLANMSHELRTPLIGILGYTEILKNEIKQAELLEMIVTIEQSGKRLGTTLNNLLDISKIEAEKQELNIKSHNIVRYIKEQLHLFKAVAQLKGLELALDISQENITAQIDKEMFESIISNLLSNALKYTNNGSITVDAYSEDESAIIKIKDTGIGISEELQEIIFEPFRQGSEGLSRRFEGTGLGLTIVKKYIELMGGKISLESKEGVGTTFTLKLKIIN